MFRQVITTTPLVTEVADTVFTRISGQKFDGDVSFLSTLRALIEPRMSDEDDKVKLNFTSSTYTIEQINRHGEGKVLEAMAECHFGIYEMGNIHVHNLCSSSPEDNLACMRLLEDNFCNKYGNYHRLQKVTDFFRKSFGVICFIDECSKNVALFCEQLNYQKLHYLQCGILAFMPWYFNPEDGVTESEMALIKSLRGRDAAEYIRCIEEISKGYNFREKQIKMMLDGFESRIERRKLRDAEDEIGRISENINDLYQRISNYVEQKSQKEIWLLGLKSKIESDEEESEVMDYFLSNKNLTILNVSDGGIRFACQSYLDDWKEDLAESVISNRRSYVYRVDGYSYEGYVSSEDMQMLMNEIFIEQNLKIKFCAAYDIPLTGTNVSALEEMDYGPEYNNCMPNPHHDRYECLGNHRWEIGRFLENHDYIGAIEQCIASTGSLNFGDSAVMEIFMKRFYGCDTRQNRRCVELPDGSVVKPEEAIKFLKEQKKEEKEDEQDD